MNKASLQAVTRGLLSIVFSSTQNGLKQKALSLLLELVKKENKDSTYLLTIITGQCAEVSIYPDTDEVNNSLLDLLGVLVGKDNLSEKALNNIVYALLNIGLGFRCSSEVRLRTLDQYLYAIMLPIIAVAIAIIFWIVYHQKPIDKKPAGK